MNKSIRELRLVAEASVLAIGLLMSSGASADDDLMRTARQIFHPIPSVIPAVKDNQRTLLMRGRSAAFGPEVIISATSVDAIRTARGRPSGSATTT
ncbi:hypothetical protein ACVWW4_004260 [Bradyrhizobium sp. LB7.1]